jgi:hypothetical protein
MSSDSPFNEFESLQNEKPVIINGTVEEKTGWEWFATASLFRTSQ